MLRFPVVTVSVLLVAAVIGCSTGRPPSVPRSAKSVAMPATGGGETLSFTAPERGIAYVFDRSTNNMVYTGWLKGGEMLELDPRQDEVRIEGRAVVERDLPDGSKFEVWFDPRHATATGRY